MMVRLMSTQSLKTRIVSPTGAALTTGLGGLLWMMKNK